MFSNILLILDYVIKMLMKYYYIYSIFDNIVRMLKVCGIKYCFE